MTRPSRSSPATTTISHPARAFQKNTNDTVCNERGRSSRADGEGGHRVHAERKNEHPPHAADLQRLGPSADSAQAEIDQRRYPYGGARPGDHGKCPNTIGQPAGGNLVDVIAGQCRDRERAHQNPGVMFESVAVLSLDNRARQNQPGHQAIDTDCRQPDRHRNQQPPTVSGVIGHPRHHDRQTR